ncbi:hypothetical protein DL96DRAFT_458546 [Flagelloscypha sp. PMI_526]|nr:hypothetical protein DL96DRAFT_458546 [Flagelloscypha sp. PMI_526]
MTGTGGGKKYAVEGIDTVAEDTGEKPSKPVPRVSVPREGPWASGLSLICMMKLHTHASFAFFTAKPLPNSTLPSSQPSHLSSETLFQALQVPTPYLHTHLGDPALNRPLTQLLTSVGPSSYYSHRRDSTVELHSQHPASLTVAPAKVLVNTFGARPYPEWRTSVTQRAVDAGWGVVNRATQCLLREEFGGFDDVLGGGRSGVKSIRSSSSSTMTSASTTTVRRGG